MKRRIMRYVGLAFLGEGGRGMAVRIESDDLDRLVLSYRPAVFWFRVSILLSALAIWSVLAYVFSVAPGKQAWLYPISAAFALIAWKLVRFVGGASRKVEVLKDNGLIHLVSKNGFPKGVGESIEANEVVEIDFRQSHSAPNDEDPYTLIKTWKLMLVLRSGAQVYLYGDEDEAPGRRLFEQIASKMPKS